MQEHIYEPGSTTAVWSLIDYGEHRIYCYNFLLFIAIWQPITTNYHIDSNIVYDSHLKFNSDVYPQHTSKPLEFCYCKFAVISFNLYQVTNQ